MVISVQKAEYKGSFKIVILFSDGIERTVEFESFLKQAKNPMTKNTLTKSYLNPSKLKMAILFGTTMKCASLFGIYTKEKSN
jgi:hypothetical protein